MGSPEKPLDVEMGDMGGGETDKLNPVEPQVEIKGNEKNEEDRFTGLKKEELLEISGQRKWVVARWILFILFWLAWIGMLVGAIVIVIKAPRCKEDPTPPWFQDTVVYQADVRKFAEDFNGMSQHIDYVRKMNVKTLTTCHANDPDDLTKVRGGDTAEFKKVIDAAHDDKEDKNIMVVVDLRIDALSVNSPEFKTSATKQCVDNPDGENCTMFKWMNTSEVPSGETGWVANSDRNQSYKTVSGGSASVNYADPAAREYLKNLIKTWIGYGVDGFQLRDMNMIDSSQQVKVVEAVQLAINETQEALEKDKRKVIGVFLRGSSSAELGSLYDGYKVNDSDKAAVAVNSELAQNLTAQQIKEAIEKWRNATVPFISSYATNTMDMDTLMARFGKNKAAGLTLFSFALPGVPILKAGDETLLENDTFVWEEDQPVGASDTNNYIVTEISALRTSPHRSLRALRWDTVDAKFEFRGTNDSRVVAFSRKWDKKPTVMTIFNPTNETVYVKVNKAELEDGGVEKSLKVSISSDKSAGTFELDSSIVMKPGFTLVAEVNVG